MNVSAADIEVAVGEALPGNATAPWHVRASQRDDRVWEVELRHEASNGLVIDTGVSDPADAIPRAIELLATNREVARIARAPHLQHPKAVAGVRTLVQAFGWSRTEVRAVVGLLIDVAALSEDEADWLRDWFGADKPAPRASEIM